MALILHLETATTNCSVSVAKDGKLLAIKENNTPNYSHAEQLHVFIAELMEEASLTLSDVDAIAVSKGPGSYTGLRIGVSAAKGLCFALEIPLIAIPTLGTMVQQVSQNSADFIIPTLDARRMEVYSSVYDHERNEVRETRAEVVDEDTFAGFREQGKVLIIGSGADKCKDLLGGERVAFDSQVIPSSRDMCSLSLEKYQKREFEDVAYFEPFYLKDFVLQQKK